MKFKINLILFQLFFASLKFVVTVKLDPCEKMVKRVCVIGSGPSGMCFLYHLDQMKRQGLEIPEVVCYEKQADWGGLWNFDWRTGKSSFINDVTQRSLNCAKQSLKPG